MRNVNKVESTIVAQRTLRDVRDSKNYTIRKLADGNCWMTQGLKYSLSAGVAATGSYTTGGTFSFTPTSCSTNGKCVMNGNTVMNTQNRDGYYYNYYAATAGTNMDVSGVDATGSICPDRWRLPGVAGLAGSDSSHSYAHLLQIAYSATGAMMSAAPLNFALTGWYNGGNHGDTRGFYWNATAHFLLWSSTTVLPQHGDPGLYMAGFNVRCVAI